MALSLQTIVFRYTLFAIIATVVNLAMQRVSLAFYDGAWKLVPAILLGTAAGLVVKYVLDKRWIFNDDTTGAAETTKQFGLYTAMGLVTTAIFWGTETVFYMIWETDIMREVGAVIGLSIGYVTKYQLDKRYVFNVQERARPEVGGAA
ncbi:MAG: GtrA family protein [Pseudomonadota bacterium]